MQKPLLVTRNIVINGQFSVPLFDKYFFIINKIVAEEDITGPPLSYNNAFELATKKFHIGITNVQMVIHSMNLKEQDELNKIVLSIIDAAKNRNVVSFGMNFDWIIPCENEKTMSKATKELFYVEKSKIASFFNSDDALYGYYASKDIDGGRLKLDVKPIKYTDVEVKKKDLDGINYRFNFHFVSSDITPLKEKYKEFSELSEKLINNQ